MPHSRGSKTEMPRSYFGVPYTPREALEWLWCYLNPSTRGRKGLQPAPRLRHISSRDTHRVIFFGDLMPPPRGRPPVVGEHVRSLLSGADLVVGNLETPIGRDHVAVHRFQISRQTLLRSLEQLGIAPNRAVLSVANNHLGDLGPEGARGTIDSLREMGIRTVGERSPEGAPVSYIEINGMLIGLLAWTQRMNHPIQSTQAGAVSQPQALAWLRSQREARADLTIAYPHWGYEFRHFPQTSERKLAGQLADLGVDLIVGHHPHVVQPAEMLGECLCVYSLGGLVQSLAAARRWPVRLGCLLVIDIPSSVRRGSRPKFSYEIIPVVHEHARHANRVSLLDHAPAQDRDRMQRRFDLLFPTV